MKYKFVVIIINHLFCVLTFHYYVTDDDVMFVAVVPKVAGDFSEFETSEGYDNLFATLAIMHPRKPQFKHTLTACHVKIPQFETNYNYESLKADLESMGVRSAFDQSKADFSGMLDQQVVNAAYQI